MRLELERRILAHAMAMIAAMAILAGAAMAHEVWIDVQETAGDTLEINVIWGHFPDQLDPADPEDYSLFVVNPDGDVNELELKAAGQMLRSIYTPEQPGEYVFRAVRQPGTYAPQDGPVTLSVQAAKAYHLRADDTSAQRPAGNAIEIVPVHDLRGFRGGLFAGRILVDGEPAPGATVSAYDDGLHVSVTTDENGMFSLDLDGGGTWLIKANIQEETGGEIEGEEYGRTSRTATLTLNLPKWQSSDLNGHQHGNDHGQDNHHRADHDHAQAHDHYHGTPVWHALIILLAGILLGSAATLVIVSKKLKALQKGGNEKN